MRFDNNVVGQVFGSEAPPAGKGFLNWLNSGNGLLVVGGQLRRELNGSSKFKEWLQQAILAGLVRLYDDGKVDDRAEELKNAVCRPMIRTLWLWPKQRSPGLQMTGI